jgi:hypothetical protein
MRPGSTGNESYICILKTKRQERNLVGGLGQVVCQASHLQREYGKDSEGEGDDDGAEQPGQEAQTDYPQLHCADFVVEDVMIITIVRVCRPEFVGQLHFGGDDGYLCQRRR